MKDDDGKQMIRKAVISETVRNIDFIAKKINEGYTADKEWMMKLINRMIAFLNEFVQLKEADDDKHGTASPVVADEAVENEN